MTFVMKADGSSGGMNHAQKILPGGPYDELWIQVALYFPPAYVACFGPLGGRAFSGDFYLILDAGAADEIEGAFLAFDNTVGGSKVSWWTDFTGSGKFGGPVLASHVYCFRVHIKVSTNEETVTLDGIDYPQTVSLSNLMQVLQVGTDFATAQTNEFFYIGDVRVGTGGPGSSDVFADDFSSGGFANWDSTTGTVSVIASPVGPVVCTAATTLTLTPNSGLAGIGVSASGSGFDPSSPLTATFDGSAVVLSGVTSTDGAGAFAGALFSVPSPKPPNTYDVTFTT